MITTDKSLKITLFTNYGIYALTALAQIITLPMYLSLFGLDNWAYIGYLLLTQSLFSLIDAGFILGLQKIFSLNSKNYKNNFDILKTFEIITFLMIITISILVIIGFVFNEFLEIIKINVKTFNSIIGGIAIYAALALSLPHKAFLLTNNRQILNNSLTCLMLILRHSVAIIFLSFFLNILTFIFVHLFFAIAETLIRIFMTWSSNRNKSRVNFTIISIHRKDLTKIILSTILGAAVLQVNKLIAANMLNEINFAKYTIAVTLGIGVVQLMYPLNSTTLPKYLSAKGDLKILNVLNFKIGFFIIVILSFCWIAWNFLGIKLINLYLGSSVDANEIYNYITIFLIGSSLYTFAGIIQNNIMSHSLVSVLFYNNLICLVLITLMQPFLIYKFGINGACLGWVCINLITIIIHTLSIYFFKRKSF